MNRSKAKGTAFETAVCEYLAANGFPFAERRALRGAKDCGDVTGIPGVVVSCKNEKRVELAGYVDEAETQRQNAGASSAIVIVKRRGKGVAGAYVLQPLAQWCAQNGDLEARSA